MASTRPPRAASTRSPGHSRPRAPSALQAQRRLSGQILEFLQLAMLSSRNNYRSAGRTGPRYRSMCCIRRNRPNWSKSGKIRPKSPDIGPLWANIGPNSEPSSHPGPFESKFGELRAKLRRIPPTTGVESWPTPGVRSVGKHRSSSAPHVARSRPSSLRIGDFSEQIRLEPGPSSAEIGFNLVEIGTSMEATEHE